ncbi:MAG: SpoIIE family protein phosphatase [bacterium]|nr:SpoIIE family protein phosphatase [bacterium]
MGYVHVEVEWAQSPKKPGRPCGDVVVYERTPSAVTVICSDGLGSGIKANIAATMCAHRLQELLRQGFSLRRAFNSVMTTMNAARGTDMPYAVFTVLRILNDGAATVLSYEMPPPILLGPRQASVLPQRTMKVGHELVGEVNCYVEPGDGIVIMSDGITQAGLGCGMKDGWQAEGVSRYVTDCLSEGVSINHMPAYVHQRAREIWGTAAGDDCTVALAACRWGTTVNVLTGPPLNPSLDREVIERFMQAEGRKVVCGASTAKMLAERLGRVLTVDQDNRSLVTPPSYHIDGIDLVTEGAVTLNQVYNIIDEDPEEYEPDTSVTALCDMFRTADRVNFTVGRAANPGHGRIDFRMRGLLPRTRIIPLIAERLRAAGKLVTEEYL